MKTVILNGALIEVPDDTPLPTTTPKKGRVFVPCLPLNTETLSFEAAAAWTDEPVKVLWSTRIPHENIASFEHAMYTRLRDENFNPDVDRVIMLGPPLGIAVCIMVICAHWQFDVLNILIYKKLSQRYSAASISGGMDD